METFSVLNQGAVEQQVSFFRFERTAYDYLLAGCAALFNNIDLSENALPLYRVESDNDGYRNHVILNRNLIPSDLQVEDIIRHGQSVYNQNQFHGSAILAVAT